MTILILIYVELGVYFSRKEENEDEDFGYRERSTIQVLHFFLNASSIIHRIMMLNSRKYL